MLDLLAAFPEASGAEWARFRGRCVGEHPDERGHALAAGAIAKLFEAHPELRGAVPGTMYSEPTTR